VVCVFFLFVYIFRDKIYYLIVIGRGGGESGWGGGGGGVGGGGVLLEILGGGVPPSSPNPDSLSDQPMSFSTYVFRPGL